MQLKAQQKNLLSWPFFTLEYSLLLFIYIITMPRISSQVPELFTTYLESSSVSKNSWILIMLYFFSQGSSSTLQLLQNHLASVISLKNLNLDP